MKRVTHGFLCILSLMALVVIWRSSLEAQDPRPFSRSIAAPTGLITLTSEANNLQQVTVIDPQTRAMAVYHVERTTGRVTLKSVRQLHWDLQLEEFNGISPLPREIQSILGR